MDSKDAVLDNICCVPCLMRALTVSAGITSTLQQSPVRTTPTETMSASQRCVTMLPRSRLSKAVLVRSLHIDLMQDTSHLAQLLCRTLYCNPSTLQLRVAHVTKLRHNPPQMIAALAPTHSSPLQQLAGADRRIVLHMSHDVQHTATVPHAWPHQAKDSQQLCH